MAMSDNISRADAIEAVEQEYKIDRGYMADDYTYGFNQAIQYVSDIILQGLPSAELPKGDLISRRWLLDLYGDYIGDNGDTKYHVPLEVVRQNIIDAPSAETHEIRTETHGVCSDLISRADAIKAVQTYLNILINSRRHGDDFTFINVLTEIRNKISALPSAEAEWIPCSERLPETHTEYVTENPWMQVSITEDTYQLSNPVLGYGKRKYHDDDDPMMAVVWYEDDGGGRTGWTTCPDCEDIDIVAWMPLPKPYREDGE